MHYAHTLAVATLVLAAIAGTAVTATAQEAPPGPPASFFGAAEDEAGSPVPEGTTIYAVVVDESGTATVADTIEVTTDGAYGGSGATADKLRVDSNAGQTVRFHVGTPDGPQASETYDLDGEGAGVSEFDLTFPEGIFDDAAGGQGSVGGAAPAPPSGDDSEDGDAGGAPGAGGSTDAIFTVALVNPPAEVTAGGDAIVDVQVTNDGTQAGQQELTLSIGDNLEDGRTLALAAGETADITLAAPVPGSLAGTETTITVASADDSDEATVSVSGTGGPTEGRLSITDVTFPGAGASGATVDVTMTLTNGGDQPRTETVTYEIDGTAVDSTPVTVAAGTSETVTLSGTVPESATGSVTQRLTAGDDEVTAELPTGESGSGDSVPGFGVASALVAVLLAVLVGRRSWAD
jgi:PGF-CTERM protein